MNDAVQALRESRQNLQNAIRRSEDVNEFKNQVRRRIRNTRITK